MGIGSRDGHPDRGPCVVGTVDHRWDFIFLYSLSFHGPFTTVKDAYFLYVG